MRTRVTRRVGRRRLPPTRTEARLLSGDQIILRRLLHTTHYGTSCVREITAAGR